MICSKCHKEFAENLLQESHDVPCYLFDGNRAGRKNQADKFGRHWLCENCHKEYEERLKKEFKELAIEIAKRWFNDSI